MLENKCKLKIAVAADKWFHRGDHISVSARNPVQEDIVDELTELEYCGVYQPEQEQQDEQDHVGGGEVDGLRVDRHGGSGARAALPRPASSRPKPRRYVKAQGPTSSQYLEKLIQRIPEYVIFYCELIRLRHAKK
ncbi:hypothetical protein ACJJTC_002770 [Scirpophaga incertulas]